MPTVEFNDSGPALAYIKERGYASYSSIKNVRDCVVPSFVDEAYFRFGKELHSRVLEHVVIEKLTAQEEIHLVGMIKALSKNPIVCSLLANSKNEQAFGPKAALKKYGAEKTGLLVPDVMGLPIFGYFDIANRPVNIADLKTTRTTNMAAFVASMDFLQAAVYLKASGARDFYYVGICKQPPYRVMVFNVREYPQLLSKAENDLKLLVKQIKKFL